MLELDEGIQTVVATLANIEELKPEQEECVILLVKGKDIVALLPTGFGKSLIYQLALFVTKYINPIVVNADWLKAGSIVPKLTQSLCPSGCND